MSFEQEVLEILNALRGALTIDNNTNVSFCLGCLTQKTKDPFLTSRAERLINEYNKNEELRTLLSKFLCDEERCSGCALRKYCNKYTENIRKYNQSGSTIVDLFCGAGGLSLGFAQVGYKISLANDIEECCIETYMHNHPEIPHNRIIQGDIRLVKEQINDIIGEEEIDVIVGGPPCQGFSMANRQRLIDDPRNYLYRSYVEIVDLVQPRFFVMENVKGMLGVAPQVKEDFERIGYSVTYHVLNAKDYGVPQNRERLIYIGNRVNIDNEAVFSELFRISKALPHFVLGDALYGLRSLQASRTRNANNTGTLESGFIIDRNTCGLTNDYIELINQNRNVQLVYNHKARYNNDRDIEIFKRMAQGDKSNDPKIADIMPYARRNNIFKDKYYKLEEDKVCKTITAHMKFDCNMYIHPTQARGLTPREAARVQSYPDDYFFKGAYTKTYMQIGNSVPPLLGRAIATALKGFL